MGKAVRNETEFQWVEKRMQVLVYLIIVILDRFRTYMMFFGFRSDLKVIGFLDDFQHIWPILTDRR